MPSFYFILFYFRKISSLFTVQLVFMVWEAFVAYFVLEVRVLSFACALV